VDWATSFDHMFDPVMMDATLQWLLLHSSEKKS